MLYYDRINVSEEIDVNKTNESHKFIFVIIITFLKQILDFNQKYVMIIMMVDANSYKF